MKYIKTLSALLLLASLLGIEANRLPGFKVNAAVSTAGIVGVNNAHIWWDNQSYAALDAIKQQGFNTVRIVWQTNGTAARLKQIIDRCKALGLKPIPELHDVTGGSNPGEIDRMVNYWIGCKAVLTSDIWINIANEWGPAGGTVWRDAYQSAITQLRSAGIDNPLVIDAPGGGEDTDCIKTYGKELLAHDPRGNLIFSIHMYGEWNDNAKIKSELTAIKNLGLPLIIGEFGYNYNHGANNRHCKADAANLISTCQELGIGFLAWSWCGNNPENAWLDLTNEWGGLTEWGNQVVRAINHRANPSTPLPKDQLVLGDFERYTEGWSGSGITGGPWVTNEWRANGAYSLKADVALGSAKEFYLSKTVPVGCAAKAQLLAVVRHAPWGNHGSGMQARLYVKFGSSGSWYDDGAVAINSDSTGTILKLNLTKLPNQTEIKEYGVQFTSGANSGGLSAVYVDYVTLK